MEILTAQSITKDAIIKELETALREVMQETDGSKKSHIAADNAFGIARNSLRKVDRIRQDLPPVR